MLPLGSSFLTDAKPLRKFGQNFLIDRHARDIMLQFAELSRSDIVLEVGPGTGFLTEALLARAGRVVVVEKDPRLVNVLRAKCKGNRRLRIIEGDVLETELPRFDKVVSSPPYYISSRLVLLLVSKRFRLAVLTLQKEFAERLVARPGSSEYGRITVMVQHKSSVELAGVIQRDSFRPRPRVDSAVVLIRRKKPEIRVKNVRVFSDMVRFLFTQRRKKVKKVLRRYLDSVGYGAAAADVLRSLPDVRVFQLKISDFERLSNIIHEMRRESS